MTNLSNLHRQRKRWPLSLNSTLPFMTGKTKNKIKTRTVVKTQNIPSGGASTAQQRPAPTQQVPFTASQALPLQLHSVSSVKDSPTTYEARDMRNGWWVGIMIANAAGARHNFGEARAPL